MASLFRFTIRDWFWLCLVMSLALAWGGHFRYMIWQENKLTANPPTQYIYDEDLMRDMNLARERLAESRMQEKALMYGVRKLLTEKQQQELQRLMNEYREMIAGQRFDYEH